MNAEMEMPRYRDTRVTHALEIESVTLRPGGGYHLNFIDKRFSPRPMSGTFKLANDPQPNGFLIVTPGGNEGYKSAADFKKAFKAESPIEDALASKPVGCEAILSVISQLRVELYGPAMLSGEQAVNISRRILKLIHECCAIYSMTHYDVDEAIKLLNQSKVN